MTTHQPAAAEGEELDLRALLRPVRARWWLVLLIVAGVTAAAYFTDKRKPKVYQASTSVFVNLNENVAAQFALGSQQFQVTTTNELANLARLLESPGAAAVVKRKLNSPASPGELASKVTVTADSTTDFVDIKADGSTGTEAAALANAYAYAFVNQGRRQVNAELGQLRIQTEDQLAALPRSGQGVDQQRAQLVSRIRALQIATRNPNGAEQQVAPATVPGSPIAPNPRRVAELAFFLALLGATLLVYVLERLDRRVKDLPGLVELYKLPLLAVLPHESDASPSVNGLPALPTEAIEAVRMLRMNIGLPTLDKPVRTLLITSAMSEEGKSTVSRYLAMVYREAGLNVALLDADLRRGSVSAVLHSPNSSPGLTGVLLGEASLAEARVAARVALPSDSRRRDTPEETDLALLPSGGPAANPPAILGSLRMASVLRELEADHELVIIDTPPMLPVSDTLPLLSLVDGVVVVGRVKCTRRDAIRRVRAVLAGVSNVRVLGLVANDVPTTGKSYLYGYGAYYRSRKSAEPPVAVPSR